MEEDLWLDTPTGRMSSHVPNPYSQKQQHFRISLYRLTEVETSKTPINMRRFFTLAGQGVSKLHGVSTCLFFMRQESMRPRSPLLPATVFSNLVRTLSCDLGRRGGRG